MRDAWFTVGLADKAAFMAVLSNSALHCSSRHKGGRLAEDTAAAVRYQTEAVSIINQRLISAVLENEVGVSEQTIGAVAGLVCNAVGRSEFPRPMAHWLIVVNRISGAHSTTGVLILEDCSS